VYSSMGVYTLIFGSTKPGEGQFFSLEPIKPPATVGVEFDALALPVQPCYAPLRSINSAT
jgi:hypothetical protein